MLHDRRPARRQAVARQLGILITSSISSGSSTRPWCRTSCASIASGRTPIPCVHCNGDLKFATLAARRGARRTPRGDRPLRSWRRSTASLRQRRRRCEGSVGFLFTLTQDQLAHALFPVGALDKTAVRPWLASSTSPFSESRQPRDLLRRRRRPQRLPRGRTRHAHAGRHSRRRWTRGRHARRRAPLHGRTAKGPGTVFRYSPLRGQHRRHRRRSDGGAARGARAHDAEGVGRQLDRRDPRRQAHALPDPSSPPRGCSDDRADRRCP